MTYKSHHSAPGRVFDHLYDPLYTTSGYKDIWRQNHYALALSAPVHIYPNYHTMFTDLPRRPRNVYLMQQNPLPTLPSFNENTNFQLTKLNRETAVGGVDRVKFFNLPLTNSKTINLQLSMNKKVQSALLTSTTPGVPFKTIGCQTNYREQSAQTKPWFPDAIIGGGHSEKQSEIPEIVQIADLIQGDLFPGIKEVEIIERARKRREWEKSLPPVLTAREWNRRRIVLEAFEWQDWLAREDQIEYCQKLRLAFVQKMIDDRKSRMKSMSGKRLENISKRFEAEKEQKLKKLRIDYQRSIRRIEQEHKQISKKYQPVDVATEHIDPASDLYGPQMRFGVHPKHRHYMAYKTQFEARLDGLHQMQTKPENIKRFIQPREKMYKPKGTIKEVQQGLWTDKYLQYLYESLKALRYQKVVKNELAKCLNYIKKDSFVIFSTPSVENLKDESEYENAIYLQKLLKGRAIQNMIYKGRNKSRELINQIQSAHKLESVRLMHPSQTTKLTDEQLAVLAQQKKMQGLLQADAQIEEVMDQAEGTSTAVVLDFLEKELVRLMDLKKTHALYMLAEKERYQREAVEAGKRQIEELTQNHIDEIYQNVAEEKQKTATIFLENVLADCFSQIAEKEAKEKIRACVRQIDEEAQNPTAKNIVSGLLNRSVLPNIVNQIVQDNHLASVHNAIFEEKQENIEKFNVLSLRQESSSFENIENVAMYEAMRSIKTAINRTIPSPIGDSVMTYEIINDIIKNIIPEDVNVEGCENIQRNQELTAIVSDITEQVRQYAKEDSATESCESEPFDTEN